MLGRCCNWVVATAVLFSGTVRAVDLSQEVSVGSTTGIEQSVSATSGPVAVNYTVAVTLSNESLVLRPLPTPWNPVYMNGTAGVDGWWTDVYVRLPDGSIEWAGTTSGDEDVDLSRWNHTDNATVILRIHAPSGALVEQAEYRLNFAIVADGGDGTGGSGGTLRDSQPVILMLSSTPTTQAIKQNLADAPSGPPQGGSSAVRRDRNLDWVAVMAGGALGLAILFYLFRAAPRLRIFLARTGLFLCTSRHKPEPLHEPVPPRLIRHH